MPENTQDFNNDQPIERTGLPTGPFLDELKFMSPTEGGEFIDPDGDTQVVRNGGKILFDNTDATDRRGPNSN